MKNAKFPTASYSFKSPACKNAKFQMDNE